MIVSRFWFSGSFYILDKNKLIMGKMQLIKKSLALLAIKNYLSSKIIK